MKPNNHYLKVSTLLPGMQASITQCLSEARINWEETPVEFRGDLCHEKTIQSRWCCLLQVYAVDWSPDGQRVASGGKDKLLKM